MHRVFLVVVLSSSHFDFELSFFLFFFFNATATTEIYTLSLHDALPISFARPSIGSWLSYGLGTVNQNLPSFLVIAPQVPYAGDQTWGSDFLPGCHQGTRVVPGPVPLPDIHRRVSPARLQDLELKMLQK